MPTNESLSGKYQLFFLDQRRIFIFFIALINCCAAFLREDNLRNVGSVLHADSEVHRVDRPYPKEAESLLVSSLTSAWTLVSLLKLIPFEPHSPSSILENGWNSQCDYPGSVGWSRVLASR